MTMFIALSSLQSHCESLLGSCDKYRTAHSGLNHKPAYRQLVNHICHRHSLQPRHIRTYTVSQKKLHERVANFDNFWHATSQRNLT